MKNSRFKYKYRLSASKLHQKVGHILRTTYAFKHHKVYQEYPVKKINEEYPDASHKFDWVIEDLKVVIECHGRQHTECVAFGKEDLSVTIERFRAQRERDKAKKQAAIDAGYTYIIIDWTEEKEINGTILLAKIYGSRTALPPDGDEVKAERRKSIQQKRKEYLASDQHKEQLERARKYRKQQYKRLKKLKDEY